MPRTTSITFTAPLIVISLLLTGLGVFAAVNVSRQQRATSELVAREVHSMVVVQDLYISMREVRQLLNQYLRSGESQALNAIQELDKPARETLQTATALARTPEETEHIRTVAAGYDQFFADFTKSQRLPELERRALLTRWADTLIVTSILDPARACVRFNESVVDRTNQANNRTTEMLRQGFLLLGLTGGTAGIVVGLLVSRKLHRHLLELHVSVRGAAGKLEEVAGPLSWTPTSGFSELHSGLKEVELRVTKVVEQLHAREREVLRNEQLAAVGQLAAGLAHELRNPLMPLKMLVQAALERSDGVGLQGRPLRVIASEIERMERSIQSFLDFARPPTVEKRQNDMRELIGESVELISARADRQGVRLQWDPPPAPCSIEVDGLQMKQVVINLVLNAIDELGDGGTVSLTLRCDSPPPDSDEVSKTSARLGVLLTVSDDGKGFPPGQLTHIFEPFVSSKETGTGLGLSICRRIVQAHGGVITARNLLPHGASFLVWVPA